MSTSRRGWAYKDDHRVKRWAQRSALRTHSESLVLGTFTCSHTAMTWTLGNTSLCHLFKLTAGNGMEWSPPSSLVSPRSRRLLHSYRTRRRYASAAAGPGRRSLGPPLGIGQGSVKLTIYDFHQSEYSLLQKHSGTQEPLTTMIVSLFADVIGAPIKCCISPQLHLRNSFPRQQAIFT